MAKLRFWMIALICVAFCAGVSAKSIKVKGKVTYNGTGVENILITDGFSFTKTDKKGNYSFKVNEKSGFVYMTTPSNYSVKSISSVPHFYISVDSLVDGKANFELESDRSDAGKYSFIVWADPQIKRDSDVEKLKLAADDLKQVVKSSSNPVSFALGCGDIVFDNMDLFKVHNEAVSVAGIPFYEAPGNHDMDYNNVSNSGSKKTFSKVYGPAYYSFNKGKVHYVVLDNVFYVGHEYFYIGYLDHQQLDWLKKDLSYVPKGSVVVVTMHIPTVTSPEELKKFSLSKINEVQTNKEALYALLEGYKAHIVTGHTHNSNNTSIASSIYEHNHSSVCGSWWYGPVAQDGTPKGYGIVTVDGDSLQWKFKSIGYDINHQLRAYAVGQNSEQQGYVTANVWNSAEGWKVFWYEDGVKMGEMEQYTGIDPVTVTSYADPVNAVAKWIKPISSRHMFRAKPVNANAKIMVEAVDNYGNSYQQKAE